MKNRPYVSVVVCVYNESGNNQPLLQQLDRALQSLDYELIYVNDGSTDATLAELLAVRNERLTILDLQKNYGQSAALSAGIDAAKGTFIVTMDGDQQNDPLDIIPMLRIAEEQDVDLVMGRRHNRQDNSWLRVWPSRLANGLIRRVLDLPIDDNGCALKVFRADFVKRIGLYGELHRFIAALAHLDGARIVQVPVRHHPRRIGQSKYGLGRTGRVLSDLFLLLFFKRYLNKPMHLFGGLGMLLLVGGLFLSIRFLWTADTDITSLDRLAIGGIWLLAGLQFLTFGISLDLQMRTYYESQGKKNYIVRRTYTYHTVLPEPVRRLAYDQTQFVG
ncbi:glycosyltransferase family 2 protein [Spirosoma fluviale]|uniref:Glycosyltransferase involved in cell wall bisynthesis n=1 Tax=Spirosoma fluviale TaxID=1597977 RepID=A0A286G9P6_9BACT|nr:glycosyltransferase family 2 protein [Spirosoma fluviale]SOD91839.1 Glycosyltransferase involved in cell wall bisynthesis [Spirosoma fluviale]